jgi:hypothetical protein
MDRSATVVIGEFWNFSTFSVALLVFGCSERSSSSTDTRPTLERECHSETAVRLKECCSKPHKAFKGFR